MNDGSSQPIIHIPWYRMRWFKWLLVSVALVAVAIAAVATVFLAMWWNGPEKALLDATNYALAHDGQYHIASKQADINVTAGADNYAVEGTYHGLQFNAVLSGGLLYVKSPDPAKLYQLLMAANDTSLPAATQTIADSVRNRWVSVNLNTVTLQSEGAQDILCVVEEKDSITSDPNARGQWRSAYLMHRFFNMQTTQHTDSMTYAISIDSKTRQDFFAALLKTSFYQGLKDCSQTTDILSSIKATSPLATVTMTAKHVFQSIVVDPHSSDPVTITASYSHVPQVSVPTDSISFDQLAISLLGSFNGLQ
jgi:hypothetical protein